MQNIQQNNEPSGFGQLARNGVFTALSLFVPTRDPIHLNSGNKNTKLNN